MIQLPYCEKNLEIILLISKYTIMDGKLMFIYHEAR